MSNSPINPGDLLGGLIGGLLSQGQGANNPFDLGKVLGDFMGEGTAQPTTPQAQQRPSTPSAGRVASDVFTAAGSAAEFLKDRFPKKEAAATLAAVELTDTLMTMLAEHDGFHGISESKRETLYGATAKKWATKILNPEKTATQKRTAETTPAPAASPETPEETVIPVTVKPREVVSLEKQAPAITEEILQAVAAGIHLEQNPNHPEWDICKEQNQVCKYNTLGRAMAILKNPEA